METLYHLSWRAYPALALTVLGAVLVARAAWGAWEAARRYRFGTDSRSLTLMRDFRRVVIGLALVGIAAGWYWRVPWLLAVAVVIGVGETLESSTDIVALERAERLPRPRSASMARHMAHRVVRS